MSILEYDEGDHPGLYQGLRIVRQVGKEYRQRYLAYRRGGEYHSLAEENRLRAEAEALDGRWLEDQQRHQQRVRAAAHRNRGHDSPFNTGVRGIRAIFHCERKKRAGQVRVYYSPIFRVHGQHEGRVFHRDFRILKLGYDRAWAEAVAFYARNKGLRQWAHLRRRRPDPSIFIAVRDAMAANGHEIPDERLPENAVAR